MLTKRVLSVRHRATVYAEVDIDSGRLVSVSGDLESIRADWIVAEDPLSLVEPAFDELGREIPVAITKATAKSAFRIAETEVWPEWDIA
jgi:hypothetical protein